MNEMERRLKRLKLKAPPAGLEHRVKAQKPKILTPSDGCWWQRRIAVPLPVLGLLVMLLIGLSGFSAYHATKSPSPEAKVDVRPAPTTTSPAEDREPPLKSDDHESNPISHAVAYYVPGHGVVYSKQEIHQ